MDEKGGDLSSRQARDRGSRLPRKPSRRRLALGGLVFSLGVMYWSLAFPSGPQSGPAILQYFGLLEGLGAFFGSVAELLPEEQKSLARILQMWAGLFAICGFVLIVARGLLGP